MKILKTSLKRFKRQRKVIKDFLRLKIKTTGKKWTAGENKLKLFIKCYNLDQSYIGTNEEILSRSWEIFHCIKFLLQIKSTLLSLESKNTGFVLLPYFLFVRNYSKG